MNHKLIGSIFAVLYLLCALPLPWTSGAQGYLFGWLPVALAYWWVLMIVNLVFVLWVCKCFVNASKDSKEGAE